MFSVCSESIIPTDGLPREENSLRETASRLSLSLSLPEVRKQMTSL